MEMSRAEPAPLPYFVPGPRRIGWMWRVAPRRCVALAAAWAVAGVALLLPGCDLSTSANRTDVRPTYVVYGLTANYTAAEADGSDASTASNRAAESDRATRPSSSRAAPTNGAP